MNWYLITANILTFLAFAIHTFVGDKEIRTIEPKGPVDKKTGIWTMSRCGWHWISFDLLFATIGLSLINLTGILTNKIQLLQMLSWYFFGYGLVWLITITISKAFPKNYFKLGQWMLLWLISGLIYFGTFL